MFLLVKVCLLTNLVAFLQGQMLATVARHSVTFSILPELK